MKIVIAAGGSGGHIFPAISFARELDKMDFGEVYFVASKRQLDKNILITSGYPSMFLSINPMPFNRNPLKWARFFFKLFLDMVKSFSILIRLEPDVVAGFGGYSSGSILRCAKTLGIPVVIHEQNVCPGRANKLLARIADLVAVSFDGAEKYFSDSRARMISTGNPIRLDKLNSDREKAAAHMGLSPNTRTVLIMGGSQGATSLNTLVSQAVRILSEKLGKDIQFVHLTGKKDYEKVSQFYEKNNIIARVFSFLDRMDYAYSVSDLAISRSGAAALFELAYYSKPMILVPYPDRNNSQRHNAAYFSERGAALTREEKDISPEGLAKEIMEIITDKGKYDKMAASASALARPDAAKKLAEEVIMLVKNARTTGRGSRVTNKDK